MQPVESDEMGQFHGKVALITGGSRGIGKAIGTRFAKAGGRIAINSSRNAEHAAAAAAEARALGVDAEIFQADVGDRDAVQAMVRSVAERFGRIDIVVNSAARGLERPRAAIDSLPKHLRHTLDVNVLGPWFVAQEAVKHMPDGGAILNLLSP